MSQHPNRVPLLAALLLAGCTSEPPTPSTSLSIDQAAAQLSLPESLPRQDYTPRILYDSGWQVTDSKPAKRYRLRIYTSDRTDRQALIIYGHIGGSDGAPFPLPELAQAEQEPSRFDDGDRLIDLESGFAWVRFSSLPLRDRPRPAQSPAPDAATFAWRLFSTNNLFVDAVGTEFILATSKKSHFDLVYVMSHGAVEVSQRYVPGGPRVRITGGQLLRRGDGAEPLFNREDPAAAPPARRELAAEVLSIVRSALNRYNDLPETQRPTRPLNPAGSLSSLSPAPSVDNPVQRLLQGDNLRPAEP